jgi:sigma-B regulation protein RsbU (phosphoserine phosphatase)
MFLSQLVELIFDAAFVLFALGAIGVAAIRRGSGVRVLVWLALWSGAYGLRQLLSSELLLLTLPYRIHEIIRALNVVISYLLLVFALLPWRELSRGRLRHLIHEMIVGALLIAVVGIVRFAKSGSPDALITLNNLFAVLALLTLTTVVLVPPLSRKFLILSNRTVVVVGTLVFVIEALYTNLSRIFHYETLQILDSVGFAVFLFSLTFAAGQTVFAAERRLVALENELRIAREIQSTILPTKVPEFRKLRIAAAYYPMAEVAGDFYDVLKIDDHRAGFLVADASGHGVPAALIASMVKVAFRSVMASAADPSEVLRGIGQSLGQQLRGQFVSAAYLYLDTKCHQARYSSAGHPPLHYWESGTRRSLSIESNGILFGITEGGEYPVRDFAIRRGDRLLLYTDGITEAQNQSGEFFGEGRLLGFMQNSADLPAEARSGRLCSELRAWRGAANSQQDDITWIAIDVC